MGQPLKAEPEETRIPAAPQPKPVDAKELSQIRDAISKHRKAIAWQVHRWPLEKRVVDRRTKIHLPRSYRAADGEDVKTVWAGSDLNQVVHNHYIEALGDEAPPAQIANFVTPDSITVKRHEYLGPDPRIAGYRFDHVGEVHIKFWDNFLQDQWMGKSKWRFDVKMTEEGKWVEIDD